MHPSFFCNYNTENHSKHSQVHYNPHYMEDQPSVFQQQQQQKPFANDHNHHHQQPSLMVVPHHENSNLNVQSDMQNKSGNSSSHVVYLEKKRIPIKRSSKKDRHSKINTARGPRDRRMRLSFDVAKKFFRLQDMLGFDKASNTIEWLIIKSKPAIRDLLSQHSNQNCGLIGALKYSMSSASSGSECEVVSDIDDQSSLDKTTGEDQDNIAKFTSCSSSRSNKVKKKKKVVVPARKSSVYIDHIVAKETREKARARARKRTSEKRNIIVKFGSSDTDGAAGCDQLILDNKVIIDQNTNRLGSWVPFGENQVHTSDQQPPPEYPTSHILQFKQGEIAAAENSSVMLNNNWMPPSLFNYHNHPGSSHEHQFSDFQIQGKPWAGIHN